MSLDKSFREIRVDFCLHPVPHGLANLNLRFQPLFYPSEIALTEARALRIRRSVSLLRLTGTVEFPLGVAWRLAGAQADLHLTAVPARGAKVERFVLRGPRLDLEDLVLTVHLLLRQSRSRLAT